ncbi:MAG: hypothetical protein AABO58_02380 [Acidobacteriota bacterium]
MTTKPALTAFSLATLLALSAAFAQEPPPPQPPQQQKPAPQPEPQPAPVPAEPQPTPPPPPPEPPPPAPAPQPNVLSRAAGGAYDRRDSFPSVNVYLPEGQASIRLKKLIRNVLFESQVDYKFVSGDISTFLRYKYYARQFTYKLGVFDSIEFGDIGQSTEDFTRVRGGLLLLTFPRDYNRRYFALLQNDRLTFGDVAEVDNRKNNIYMKFGVQYGTEFDERLNAIVGESRGRIVPVLTAFRELGPQKFSVAAAITESAKVATGDYTYTKFETEAIKRWDVSPTSFVVTRAHLGSFPTRGTRDENAPLIERYAIPSYELFRIGGREALRSISTSKDLGAGTNEIHLINEYFAPVFRNRNYRKWGMNWNTLYAIGYVGTGNVGFEFRDLTRVKDFAVDAGLGTEASIGIRDFNVLLSVLYARTVRDIDGLKGSKVRFSIRTVR